MSQTLEGKLVSLQSYHLLAYRRALHPELFSVKARRVLAHDGYEIEIWVMPGAHMLRFQYGAVSGVELITHQESGLPERGVVASLPCAGEKDFDHLFSDDVNYMTSIQTETLPQNIFKETYNELVEFGAESDAVMHFWTDADGGKCGSIVDLQLHHSEVHVQAYHMLSQEGIVLRSQALFEIRQHDE